MIIGVDSYRNFVVIMALANLAFVVSILMLLNKVDDKIEEEVIICKIETKAYNENFVMCENGSAKK